MNSFGGRSFHFIVISEKSLVDNSVGWSFDVWSKDLIIDVIRQQFPLTMRRWHDDAEGCVALEVSTK